MATAVPNFSRWVCPRPQGADSGLGADPGLICAQRLYAHVHNRDSVAGVSEPPELFGRTWGDERGALIRRPETAYLAVDDLRFRVRQAEEAVGFRPLSQRAMGSAQAAEAQEEPPEEGVLGLPLIHGAADGLLGRRDERL